VSNVRHVVDGGAAAVDRKPAFTNGRELIEPSGQRVVNPG